MFHSLAAHLSTWTTKTTEAVRDRARGREDDGLESIEVVVLSVVGLAIVIALGAAIKALVERYQSQLV